MSTAGASGPRKKTCLGAVQWVMQRLQAQQAWRRPGDGYFPVSAGKRKVNGGYKKGHGVSRSTYFFAHHVSIIFHFNNSMGWEVKLYNKMVSSCYFTGFQIHWHEPPVSLPGIDMMKQWMERGYFTLLVWGWKHNNLKILKVIKMHAFLIFFDASDFPNHED